MYNTICGFEEETSVLCIFHVHFWYRMFVLKLSNKVKTIATPFYSFIFFLKLFSDWLIKPSQCHNFSHFFHFCFPWTVYLAYEALKGQFVPKGEMNNHPSQ